MSWEKEPAAREWIRHVLEDTAPKIEESAICVALAPFDGGEGDVKFWVELGCMIMLDKPIIVVAKQGQVLPTKLLEIADEVVMGDPADEHTQKRLRHKVQAVMERHP